MGSVGEPATVDVGAGNITSPPRTLSRCQYYSANELITVEVCNPGLTTIPSGSAIPMDMEVDGILLTSEALILSADLNPGDSVPYMFATFQCVMGLPGAPFFAVSNAVQLLHW